MTKIVSATLVALSLIAVAAPASAQGSNTVHVMGGTFTQPAAPAGFAGR